MEYLAFILWCFAVALAGGLVGLVLGNLRLPGTLAIASSPAAGAGANLVVSAAAAASASVTHVRAGRVDWRLFAWMAPPSVVGAIAGGYLSGVLPRRVLLASIAIVLAGSAVQLWRWRRPARAPLDADAPDEDLDIPVAVVAGAAIGVLGGMVGLILGSLRMPALLRLVGAGPARAAGTNLAVGVCVGIAGALGHLPSEAPDWRVAAVGAAASMPGAVMGARITGRLSEEALIRAIAVVVAVAAVATGAQAAV